jgi:signal transduction histidine kinase
LPRRFDHRLIFACAISLLIVCGLALAFVIQKIYSGERWVRHTYAVQLLVAEIEGDAGHAGRARQVYVHSADKQELQDFEQTRKEIAGHLSELKGMVEDNADQRKAVEGLQQAIQGRFSVLDSSIRLADSGKSTIQAQDELTSQIVQWSQTTSSMAQNIENAESSLLDRRLLLTKSLSVWVIIILAVTYVLALYMLWEHYRGLSFELAERKTAERYASSLSAQLLRAEDQERRKIARDLHDGLGQCIVGAKLIVDSLVKHSPENQQFQDLRGLLQEAVASTRSVSHLLHPPLLDELGFVASARSYLEGFSKRTGIEISVDLPDLKERLPSEVELTLLRILQEALTNIQRHSRSAKAGVRLETDGVHAKLTVWDQGVGMPAVMLHDFRNNGISLGVGLAGIRERVRERKGHFEVHSDSRGTAISATLPVVNEPQELPADNGD